MRRLVLLLILISSYSYRLLACGGTGLPSFGGEIRYSIDSGNPLKVNFIVTLYFESNEALKNDSIVLGWGDNTFGAMYATSIDTDSIAFANYANSGLTPQIYRHIYNGSHTYNYDSLPSSGYFTAFLTNTYRPGSLEQTPLANINDGQSDLIGYTIVALVHLDNSPGFHYTPPTMVPVDILLGTSGQPFVDNTVYSVPKGDSVVSELITPWAVLDTGNNVQVPLPILYSYLLPSEYCNGNSDNSFSVNPNTGVISWPSPCYDTLDLVGDRGNLIFDFATRITTYRGGELVGSIMRDQYLYIAGNPTSAISEVTAGALNIYPNPANSELHVVLPDNTGAGTITLTDMSGQKLIITPIINSTLQTLDISALAQGIYTVTLENSHQKLSQRFVKQ